MSVERRESKMAFERRRRSRISDLIVKLGSLLPSPSAAQSHADVLAAACAFVAARRAEPPNAGAPSQRLPTALLVPVVMQRAEQLDSCTQTAPPTHAHRLVVHRSCQTLDLDASRQPADAIPSTSVGVVNNYLVIVPSAEGGGKKRKMADTLENLRKRRLLPKGQHDSAAVVTAEPASSVQTETELCYTSTESQTERTEMAEMAVQSVPSQRSVHTTAETCSIQELVNRVCSNDDEQRREFACSRRSGNPPARLQQSVGERARAADAALFNSINARPPPPTSSAAPAYSLEADLQQLSPRFSVDCLRTNPSNAPNAKLSHYATTADAERTRSKAARTARKQQRQPSYDSQPTAPLSYNYGAGMSDMFGGVEPGAFDFDLRVPPDWGYHAPSSSAAVWSGATAAEQSPFQSAHSDGQQQRPWTNAPGGTTRKAATFHIANMLPEISTMPASGGAQQQRPREPTQHNAPQSSVHAANPFQSWNGAEPAATSYRPNDVFYPAAYVSTPPFNRPSNDLAFTQQAFNAFRLNNFMPNFNL